MYIEQLKEIGKRLYHRQYVSANEGNLSIRDGDTAYCTPTMVCKGFLTEDDYSIVRISDGQHSEGKKPTSEIKLHLAIYNNNPEIKAVVHSHPPHATAFAITHGHIPSGILPEVEIFIGHIPTVGYYQPGSQEFADSVIPYIKHHNVILLKNHGLVTFSPISLERAYWLTEITDSYCRTLLLAKPKEYNNINHLNHAQIEDLRKLRSQF